MNTKEYTESCRRTETRNDWDEVKPELAGNVRLVHTLLGLSTEAGEAIDIFKKSLYYKREFDVEHFKSELGDLLWYLAMAADIVGSSLEEVMEINVKKLAKRYPEKFTTDLANHRKEGDI